MNWGKCGTWGFAGVSEQDMVGGSIRGEGRVGLNHVAEKSDGIVDGGGD